MCALLLLEEGQWGSVSNLPFNKPSRALVLADRLHRRLAGRIWLPYHTERDGRFFLMVAPRSLQPPGWSYLLPLKERDGGAVDPDDVIRLEALL